MKRQELLASLLVNTMSWTPMATQKPLVKQTLSHMIYFLIAIPVVAVLTNAISLGLLLATT